MQKFTHLILFSIIIFSSKSICLSQNYKTVDKQNTVIDSLLNIIKNTKEDTLKVKVYNKLFLEYEFIDRLKAKECLNNSLALSKKNNFKNGLADAYIYLGYYAEDDCNYPEAIECYTASLKVCESMGDKYGMAISYNDIGNIYSNQGKYPEALKTYIASLKLSEEIKDKDAISNCYNNIGIIYRKQKNFSEALKNYYACLKIKKELGDKRSIAYVYNHIGLIYFYQNKYTEALKNYYLSLKISEEIEDYNGISSTYNNLGGVCFDQKNYEEALKNYFASLKIAEKMNDKVSIASSYVNIGDAYTRLQRYNEAKIYLIKAKELSNEIGYIENLRIVYYCLSSLDSSMADYKGAYENHKLYILYRDSLDNEETRKKTVQTQMTYEFEKKEAVAKAEHKKEIENQKLIAEERSRKQRIIIMFVVIGLLLVIIFAGFIYRSLRITRKQKKTIELQKLEVDEKNLQLNQQNEEIRTQRDEIEAQRDEIEAQRDLVTEQKVHIEEIHKEVTDSINYAKRIQEALLPVSDSARSVLGEHFVLFKPKNIVSGDFYWTTKINNLLFVAVADCTGHGVPGAFMSMLGISFLNEIVQKQEINKASQILNQLRTEIINALQQKGISGEQKDGLDISLLVLNTETNEAQWAGANNPLYIIKTPVSLSQRPELIEGIVEDKGAGHTSTPLSVTDNFIELKGDKMPIAIYPVMNDFTNHEFVLQKGDSVFLFTDGYADQFGGSKGRKFMYKKFKEILLENVDKPMLSQRLILENTLEEWKGIFEQIDDITILSMRILK